jgi:hypothetical protein
MQEEQNVRSGSQDPRFPDSEMNPQAQIRQFWHLCEDSYKGRASARSPHTATAVALRRDSQPDQFKSMCLLKHPAHRAGGLSCAGGFGPPSRRFRRAAELYPHHLLQ